MLVLVHPVQHSPLRLGEDAGRRYLQPLLRQLKRQPAPGVSGGLAHLLRVGLAQLQKLMLQSLVVGVDTGCALRLVEIDNRLLLDVGQPHGVTSPGPGWGERTASIYTHNEALKHQLLELCQTHPAQVRQTAANAWGGLTFELPKKWLRVTPPRVLSPAQRAVLDRMNQNKQKDG